MTNLRAILASSTAILVAVLFTTAPAFAQKESTQTDAFFKSMKVVHVDVEVDPKPLSLIRMAPRHYVAATLTADGETYPDVGIHLRGGAGSYRHFDDKPGLTVNMHKFGGDKNFHGMDKWHLNNSVQDPSYLSEIVCGELMRAAGVPAARFHHAVVTLNGRMLGMYTIKEGYDKNFLKRNFTTSDGNFYDGGFLRDIDQPLELIRTRDDVKDWADLKALVAAAREPDVKKRFEKMEKVLDVDKFISMFVVQAIVGDWDGYVSNRNNYRVYHDPKRDKIVFIPSGMDQEFGNVQGGIIPGVGGLVAVGLIQTPEGRDRYLKRMAELNATIMDGEKWSKRLDELQAKVQPELAKVNAGAGADYPNQVNRIRAFFRERSKSIERQLKTMK